MDAAERREEEPVIPADALNAALEQMREGRVIPSKDVRAWLASWGRQDERPNPVLPEAAARAWR